MPSQKRVHPLLLLLAFGLLADLAYCRVIGSGVGLDPSWVNGITRAAELHLTFGREIVFTYGPLGYLISGAGTPESFRYIFVARVFIALLFSGSIVYYCSTLPLRRFVIAMSAILIAACLIQDRVSACNIAIVAVSMLVLDRRSRRQPYEALAIGVLAGVAALTKFTAGVQFGAAIGIVLAFGVLRELRSGDATAQSRYSLVAFVVAAVATMSAILDSTIQSPALSLLVWCICIATLLVAVYNRFTHARTTIVAFGISMLAAIVLVALGDTKDLVANSLQISIGYSAAMNTIPATGGAAELTLGVRLLLLLTLVVASQRSALSFGVVLGFLILGWLDFKEGYVREDYGHVVEFLIPMVLFFALLTISATTRRGLAFSLLAFSVACFSLAVTSLDTEPASAAFAFSRLSDPNQDVREALGPSIGNDVLSGYGPDVFDDGSAARLKSLPIDVQPWEATVAFANGLVWKPEPIFQSYSAYTPILDGLNARSLAAGKRRVLVDFEAIDGRNFMAESPLARRALLCDYRVDPQFGHKLAHVSGGERYAVLSAAPANRCRSRGTLPAQRIVWDRAYRLPATPPNTLTFLALDMRYSRRGTLIKTLLRGPEVTIEIGDGSGAAKSSRILPQNAVNGFLVDPNPASTDDFVRILSGNFMPISSTYSIHTDMPEMYRPDIEATIEIVSYTGG